MTGRHLQSKEVSHQLFLAQEHLGVPRACPYGNGDFVPSEVIEGASTWGVGVSGEDSLWSQLRSHPVGRDPDVSTTLLPFLNTATFARENRAMRPMISQLGVADVVASELDISEGGHEDVGQLNGANERMGRGVNKSVNVVFRLDRNNPGRTAGFLYTESPQEKVDQGGSGSTQHEGSILTRCVRGTLRGSDALAYWTEVNHPDDVNGGTAHEWSEYVHHIGNARLTCEPLFVSLAQLLRLPEDTEVTLRRRRSSFIPSKEQRLVPLEVLESQLEALRKEFLLTREGIDITGLRPEVQQALARRRITRSQLSEIERARFEKVQQERPEDPQRLALTSTANKMTREERLVAALRFYKGVTGEDVSAVRVKLPHHSSFTVPHNLFLRTALHKDLMCGTSVSPMSVAPASVVLFSRVELIDEPPTVGASPQAIKQCEVEGRIPPIYVNVSAARFVRGGSFPSENVLLEELPNPNVSVPRYTANVGIAPCLARMRAGMEVKVSPLNRRQLTLQLSPCPFFQMLSSEEYNEQQDSEWLSRRLKHPRLLRITLRDALVQDSHTRGLTTISFVVEVRPTLALLHLRSLPLEGSAFQPDWVSKGRRPLLMCEADMRRKGMELGIELVGDTWDARVGEADKETRESDGYEDQGDDGSNSFVSRNPHNEVDVVNAVSLHRDHEAGRAWDRGEAKRSWRSPQDVAMLNGFSVVEHHSFDSAHHLICSRVVSTTPTL
uniref:Uncharacterized protein TCIL3000_7_5440 n=1 Tax=Trypanosoma congolense (strain IL3000) TaxID=1068625 RepID=G0UQR9_TRYCI|nr:unnamed protein product [Trypanosoma congolense IL3000]